MSYQPPIYHTGSMVSAAASAQLSQVELELSKIRRSAGVESPAAAAVRREGDEEKMKRDTYIGSIIASVAIGTGLLAMWVEASAVVYLAFLFPLVTAPAVVHQRRKLNRLPSMREEQNKLRVLVNELAVENDELESLNDKVEDQVSRLSTAESDLERIAEAQGTSVTELQALVQENGVLMREMRAMTECQVMGQMMKAIIDSDRSRDFKIDDVEMKSLLVRLQAIQGINHVGEQELRAAFASQKNDGSIKTIVDITKALMQKDQLQIVRDAEQEQTAATAAAASSALVELV
eukprot:CAMPEP_0119016192 /NCGR_PEP_ID=MMETSP1176-20130426/11863_1 /TAXON_ID=265551 /ORGANISM="Synedropsis recta cf, Strain CCMP1620" /LENGTH=290 /DNA_ID=CAMNT_0006969527 /DNA_START=96 /DNA_END=968 /DNA_ORIENTATION=-